MDPRPLVVALLVALASACSPPAAEDLVREVVQLRNQYVVELSSWVIRDEGGPEPNLYLDVRVLNDSQSSLRTLTVLVQQFDAQEEVISTQRVAMDVGELTPGIQQNIGVEVRPAHPDVEGVLVIRERNPARDTWSEFPELDAVRPRL